MAFIVVAAAWFVQAVSSFFTAYNSGDPNATAGWASTHLASRALKETPAAEQGTYYAKLHGESGNATPLAIPADATDEAKIDVKLATGRHGRIIFLASRHEPQKISDVYIFPEVDAARLKALPKHAANDAAIAPAVRAYVKSVAAQDFFSGVYLIARDGHTLASGAYGYADRNRNVRNTMDTEFPTASMGKMFTATAIGQLIDAGKLRFDETLAEALPSYPNRDIAQKITIAQLLSHTSGLGDVFQDAMQSTDKTAVYDAPSDFFTLFANKPLAFDPGSRFSYSNSGFIVLAAIVESQSGEKFFDYVKNHIWVPAGMSHTYRGDRHIPNEAYNYAYADSDPFGLHGHVSSASFFAGMVRMKPSGHGGSVTTAGDVERFFQAFRNGRLVKPDTASKLAKYVVMEDSTGERRYGYGFETIMYGANEVAGHSGGGVGSGVDVWSGMQQGGGLDVIVLSNYDVPSGMDVYNAIWSYLLSP